MEALARVPDGAALASEARLAAVRALTEANPSEVDLHQAAAILATLSRNDIARYEVEAALALEAARQAEAGSLTRERPPAAGREGGRRGVAAPGRGLVARLRPAERGGGAADRLRGPGQPGPPADADVNCRRCGAPVAPGDRFCSECGARLAAPEPPASNGRAEAAGPGLAGQTDPGVTHAHNQDAFALSGPAAGGDGSILVLCDGVSNSQTPELAAATAARTAHEVLAGGGTMRDAIRRAHEAVCALPFDRQAEVDPPATTIVAARLQDGQATIGWLGDSRAYALGDGGGRC